MFLFSLLRLIVRVLNEINAQLASMQSIWYKESKEAQDGLKALRREIFAPKVDAVGLLAKSDDDHLMSLKRALVVSAAARSGDKK